MHNFLTVVKFGLVIWKIQNELTMCWVEFNTAYFNEISEMAFASYSKVQTRLSLKAYDGQRAICVRICGGEIVIRSVNGIGDYKTFIQKSKCQNR